MKKAVVFLTILIVAAFMLTGPASTCRAGDPVVKEWKIPFLIFLTGPYAGFGEQIKWAADQAAKEINAAGGIAGKPIRINYHDTALDPAKAVAEMSKVVKKSLFLFGPIAANTTKASMPMVVREKGFAMAIACGTDVNMEFQPYTCHFLGHYDEYIPPALKGWIEREPQIKSVVQFTWPLDPTWMDIANAQRRALEKIGVKVLPDVAVSEGVDMASAVVKAMATSSDGFIITVGPVEAGKIIKELDKRGIKDKGRIMIFVTAYDPALIEVAGDLINGCYHWNELNMKSESPRWAALFAEYQKAYPKINTPTIGVPLFYDMVYMAKDAIEKTGATGDPAKLKEERDKIRQYCRTVKKFPGVLGDFSMVDGVAKMPGVLFMIENKEAKLLAIYPPE
jgi:branched-chain amino acid transport system substrate-binding protein